MAMPRTVRQKALRQGTAEPRLAPPLPLKHGGKAFAAVAKSIGIDLMPWQQTTARYLTAIGPDARWLYRELAAVVARQQGKTTLLQPLIIDRLLKGQHIMHTAQNRELPREVHDAVANLLLEHFRDQLPPNRGIRYGAGQ